MFSTKVSEWVTRSYKREWAQSKDDEIDCFSVHLALFLLKSVHQIVSQRPPNTGTLHVVKLKYYIFYLIPIYVLQLILTMDTVLYTVLGATFKELFITICNALWYRACSIDPRTDLSLPNLIQYANLDCSRGASRTVIRFPSFIWYFAEIVEIPNTWVLKWSLVPNSPNIKIL